MRIPDFISPIIGWRVWQWDAAGLRSLNGEPWLPGKAVEARCKVSSVGKRIGRDRGREAHHAPEMGCTCGVYAAKNLEHLRQSGCLQYGIYGRVSLWGRVVEHKHGWRSQYAYPKNFFLSSGALPFTLKQIQFRTQLLMAYGCDVAIVDNSSIIPLWRNSSGVVAAGLEFLRNRCTKWYAQRKQERAIKADDRIVVLGRGLAVVERIDHGNVHARLGNEGVLSILQREILWNEQNMRWEASPAVSIIKLR